MHAKMIMVVTAGEGSRGRACTCSSGCALHRVAQPRGQVVSVQPVLHSPSLSLSFPT